MPTEDEILQSLRPQTTNATLMAVSAKAHEARNLEKQIEDLEERLSTHKAELRGIYEQDLPNLFDQAQITKVSIPASGNMPAYDLSLSPFYSANIAANWPPEKRQIAFTVLKDMGHQDLIKTEITIILPREQRAKLEEILDALYNLPFNLEASTKETVNHMTLKAWLKEQVERGNPLPPLDTIGASIGRIVKMKERKS